MTKQAGAEKDKRNQALERALAQLEKQYYKGVVMRMGAQERVSVPTISTGSLSLDLALGVNGVPKGRVIEVFGPESSGKTTLALHIVANAQKEGGTAAFVDAEHALDPEYAKKIGVKVNDLLISQPDNGEQALDIVETLVNSGAINLIVVDSVAALVPKAEIEGGMGGTYMGRKARLMSQALRKLTAIVAKSNCTVIFINQIRMKIGIMFGNPETTTGGNALKFYSSVRIEVRRSAQIKKGEDIVGNRVKAKIVKNKVEAAFKATEFEIMYNEGISASGDVLDTGVKYEVIAKKGNSYSFEEIKLGAGREVAKSALKSDPKLMQEIAKAIFKKVREMEEAAAQA